MFRRRKWDREVLVSFFFAAESEKKNMEELFGFSDISDSFDTETLLSDVSINTHQALHIEELVIPKDEKRRARNRASAAESRKRAREKLTALHNENEQLKLENDYMYLKKLLYEKQESNGEPRSHRISQLLRFKRKEKSHRNSQQSTQCHTVKC